MILGFYSLLSLLPWCCKSLKLDLVTSRIPATSRPLASKYTLFHATQFLSPGSEEYDNTINPNVNNFCEIEQEGRGRQQRQVYLFSLNWIEEKDPEYFLKKDVRRLWEWKDATLGDGRDFFVPKPKTLMALQQYLLENIPNLKECSIISNCARLEVLCTYSSVLSLHEDHREELNKSLTKQELLARDISNCFYAQLDHYEFLRKNRNGWAAVMMQLPVNVDRPGLVLTRKPPKIDLSQPFSHYNCWWNTTVGTKAILTHLCKVSAGMGSRPRRPNRPVVFRPFSSRDAHILLQLKRTRENIGFSLISDNGRNQESNGTRKNRINESNTESESSTRKERQKRKLLPLILDCALRAGKAARNSDIVIEIEDLKKMTSVDSSACTVSEQRFNQRVADVAYEKAIYPLIVECMTKLDDSNNDINWRITEFRRSAFGILREIEADNMATGIHMESRDKKIHQKELHSWLNRRLHEPTIELRSLCRQQSNTVGKMQDFDCVDTNNLIESFISDSLKEIGHELRNEHRHYRERSSTENSVILHK